MEAVNSLFYIILFISFFATLLNFSLFFLSRVLNLPISFWMDVLGLLSFFIPFVLPSTMIFSPEEPIWVSGFLVVSRFWFIGAAIMVAVFIVRSACVFAAVRKFKPSDDLHIIRIYENCAVRVGLRRLPKLLDGDMKECACVVTFMRSRVIVNASIIRQLPDEKIAAVLIHELSHIRRKHLILQRLFEVACIFHWFNPFIWIARSNFSLSCEVDCDCATLTSLSGSLDTSGYATTMLQLIELNAAYKTKRSIGLGATLFIMARRRFERILSSSTKTKKVICASISLVLICGLLLFSVIASGYYFYPYQGLQSKTEWKVN